MFQILVTFNNKTAPLFYGNKSRIWTAATEKLAKDIAGYLNLHFAPLITHRAVAMKIRSKK